MRLRSLLVAAVVLAQVSPVYAQKVEIKGKAEIKIGGGGKRTPKQGAVVPVHAPARVLSFSPQSGPTGTIVTINGEHFPANTKVVLGGRPQKTLSATDTQIKFVIPRRVYDGSIALRLPGAGNDLPVGTFQLQLDPRIAGFAPAAGPVGTRVELTGEGFQPGDQFIFNGKPLAASELTPNRVVVVIPPGAATDYFTVSRPSSNYARPSRQRFTVQLPAPTVSGLTVKVGPPGTATRILGANFSPEDDVSYGALPVQVTARAETWLDVIVPQRARESNSFRVHGPRGEARSEAFSIQLAPTIVGFAPDSGGVGTRVEIAGAAFQPTDTVSLGGVAVPIVAVTPTKLTVQIPAGAPSDRFTILRGGQPVAISRGRFDVWQSPTVAGFAPAAGPAGTVVKISGTNFGRRTEVQYGGQPLRVIGRSPNEISVAVPGGRGNHPFVLITPGGSVTTATAFQLIEYSRITSISPETGPVGTRVTITLDNAGPNDQFWLSGVGPVTPLPVVERAAGKVVVTIPPDARSGKVVWESYGNRQTSPYRFTVTESLAITAFTPDRAPLGAQITITGYGFDAATQVQIGNKLAPVISRSGDNQMVVTVPVDLVGGLHTVYARKGKVSVRAAGSFNLVGLKVAGISPDRGPIGTRLTIEGQGFTSDSTVRVNKSTLAVVSRTPEQLVVVIEDLGNAGVHPVYVFDHGKTARAPKGFTFTPVATPPPPAPPAPTPPPPAPPAPTPPAPSGKCAFNLTTGEAPTGGTIVVDATNCVLKDPFKVTFLGKPAAIVSVQGTRITLRLPAGVKGTANLNFEISGSPPVNVKSPQKLYVR